MLGQIMAHLSIYDRHSLGNAHQHFMSILEGGAVKKTKELGQKDLLVPEAFLKNQLDRQSK